MVKLDRITKEKIDNLPNHCKLLVSREEGDGSVVKVGDLITWVEENYYSILEDLYLDIRDAVLSEVVEELENEFEIRIYKL